MLQPVIYVLTRYNKYNFYTCSPRAQDTSKSLAMSATNFYITTAQVCYRCRTTALVRLMQSWREVSPISHENKDLDVVFVTCILCKEFFLSFIPIYIDPLKYLGNPQYFAIISFILACTIC